METFAISPATTRPLWFFAIILLVLVAVGAVLVYAAYASRHSRVEVDGEGIRLVGDFWGRRIVWENLRVDEARQVNLDQSPEFVPRWRTMGTGMPGYSAGWFRLRNGEKSLVYLTQRASVVYLPTTDGYSLLLSADAPEQLIASLRKHQN